MSTLRNIFGNRLVQTLMFWAISFAILLRTFSRGDDMNAIDVIYTILFHIHLIAGVSINVFFLIPRYLEKNMYAAYVSGILSLSGMSYFLYQLSYGAIASLIFPDFYFIAVYEWYETMGIIAIYLISTSLIEFSKGWFREAELKKELAETKELNTENELKVLRAQINPHFLFNSLNTIYGMSLSKDEKAPETILALSDILRYNLNSFGHENATLSQELDYFKNYLSLQQKRLDYPHQIDLNITGNAEGKDFPSLLLIELLENALKHGNIEEEGAYIHIEIAVTEKKVTVLVKNSKEASGDKKVSKTGMGLENCKRRLELLYPNQHSFSQTESSTEFSIQMEVRYA